MSHYIVDIRSDTVSLPTPEMRKAMFEAIVGDDVYQEDPTVLQLEQKSANIFEKEAGLFLPGGTMANLLASGAAHIAGVQLNAIKNRTDGTFCLDELRRKVRSVDYHEPITAMVAVENTHNMCGGKVLPLDWLSKLAALVKDPNTSPTPIALHMDGARIFNAAEAMQVPVARITKDFDSVCYCLSKGLSAPVGSVLVGSKAFISEARRLRRALGGGMRQVGVLAAAGLVAIETIVPRLKLDHQNTKRIAEAIYNLRSSNITVDLPNVQSNILLIHIANRKITSTDFATRLSEVNAEELKNGINAGEDSSKGIILKVSARDSEFARIVLYHQITPFDVELIIKKMEYVILEYDRILAA